MKHAVKKPRHSRKRPAAPNPTAAPPVRAPHARVAVLSLCLLLAGGATWAGFEFVVWNKLPAQLLGKWVIEGGEQDGATLDFFRNGTMIGRMNVRGSLAIVDARVSVEGNKLFITTQNPNSKEDETRAQTIKSLTSAELVLEDDQGKIFRLSRASERY